MCETCFDLPNKCDKCAQNRENSPNCTCPYGYSDDLKNAFCKKCDYMCESCSELIYKCIYCAQNRIDPPKCKCMPGFSDDLVSPLC